MEFADLEKLIKSRRSIRLWQDKKVSEELLIKAIQLATWAPNSGNQQNWHFYVIVNQDTIKAIADVVRASADLMVAWTRGSEIETAAVKWRERVVIFKGAPAAIAVSTAQYQSLADQILTANEATDPRASKMRQYRKTVSSQIQSVGSGVAYLLLILHQMGLGAVWMTGPMQAKGEIEKVLRVPKDMDLVAFIPVGYPAESPSPKERRPFADVCEVIR